MPNPGSDCAFHGIFIRIFIKEINFKKTFRIGACHTAIFGVNTKITAYIWAATQENLSSGFLTKLIRKQRVTSM